MHNRRMTSFHFSQTGLFLVVMALASTMNNYWMLVRKVDFWLHSMEWRQDTDDWHEQQLQLAYVKHSNASKGENFHPLDHGGNRPVFDMITVGSKTRWDLVVAQNSTFGRHPYVRNFFIFTEDDDHEAHCHSNLTVASMKFVSRFCRKSKVTPTIRKFRSRFASSTWMQKKDNPTGWLCAQKRPAESLFRALDGYRQRNKQLMLEGREDEGSALDSVYPDYLFLLDDDTYLNIEAITNVLPELYPQQDSYAVAGCMVRETVGRHNFTFPWGGFGTIFSKALIEKFLQPLNCLPSDDSKPKKLTLLSTTPRELSLREFEMLACERIGQNLVGELFLFQQGMAVADLMYKFVNHWRYTNAENEWGAIGGPGFCMHADWVLGYFTNTYYLAKHTGDDFFRDATDDRFRGWQGSNTYAGRETEATLQAKKQCLYDYDENCVAASHFCHHVTPNTMRTMHAIHTTGEDSTAKSL